LKRRCSGTRLRPPMSSVSPTASAAGGEGEPPKAAQWPDKAAACRHGGRPGHSDPGLRLGPGAFWSGIARLERRERDLGGEQSPWKDRVTGRWQRQLVTTDSSAEQSLEVGCSVRFRRALTSAHLGGCRRSATETPRLRLRNPVGDPRVTGRASSRSSGAEPAPGGGLIVRQASALRHRHRGGNFTWQRRELRSPPALCAR
jgi:hypothetical protein